MNKEIKGIKRFEATTEAKLIRALDKIFTQTNNTTETDATKLKNCSVSDPARVVMVTGKTEEAKRILSRFVDKPYVPKIPKDTTNLGIDHKELKKYPMWYGSPEAKSKYSTDYITDIINVLKIKTGYDMYFEITNGTDCPLRIDSEHFSFLLAPRIEDK